MRPCRIQLSGVSMTTPFILLTLSGAALFAPKSIDAQCPTGYTPMSVTHNSAPLTASGGNVFNFTMPQFDPTPGYTLLSAVLSSNATTGVTVNYQNTDPVNPQDFFPNTTRKDNVKVNGTLAVPNKTNEYDFNETILSAAGTPGDNVTYGPGNTFDNTTLFSTTITNNLTLTGTYQGIGNVSVSYTSNFFMSNFVPTAVTVTPTIADNITFSITYNYCNPTLLSSNILTFTADKVNSATVDLKWLTTNEQPGRKYYIEVSWGGQDFAITGSVPSNTANMDASYTYGYSIPPSATGKIYFRLRQVDADGTATWSDVRVVNLDGNGPAFSIYPNPPSDFINLTLPGDSQDWQVDIFAADGSLVLRNFYRNSNTAKVNFGRRLAASTYFVRAINPQTGKHYTGSFLVR